MLMSIEKPGFALLIFVGGLASPVLVQGAPEDPQQATARQSKKQNQTHLSQAVCLNDAKDLVKLLELSHPDPFSPMGGKVAFKRKARMLFQSLPKKGLTTDEFGEILQSFLAGLNDGHTRLQLESIPWRTPIDALPVRFDISDKGLHVSGFDLSVLDGTQGFLLKRVNGVPVPELESKLSRLIPFENTYHGHGMLRRAIVSPQLLGHLLPRFDVRKGITYDLVSPGGFQTSRKLAIAGATRKAPQKAPEAWHTPPKQWQRLVRSEEPFYFRFFDTESAAYFRVATVMGREAFEMALRYNIGDPKPWLEKHYRQNNRKMPDDIERALLGAPSFIEPAEKLLVEMRRVRTKNLVVDLRGNSGGMTPTVVPFLYMLFGDAYYAHRFPCEFITVLSQLYLDKYKTTLQAKRKERNDQAIELGAAAPRSR